MDMRKAISTMVAVVALIIVVSGVTFAWYTWSTNSDQNTGVAFSVVGKSVTQAVTYAGNKNLIPVAAKTSGYITTATLTPSVGTMYADFSLRLDTLPTNLSQATFKYELTKGDGTAITGANGSFSGKTQGDTIALASRQVLTGATSVKLYLWIDGTSSNPSTMQNQIYSFTLIANVTDSPT